MKTVSSKTFIRSFQLKFFDGIIYTNVRLAKMDYVSKDTVLVIFAKWTQKRSFIYVMNVPSQIFSLKKKNDELLQPYVFKGKGKSQVYVNNRSEVYL